jgi:drug/metabolite transporter (DMT)-like permease
LSSRAVGILLVLFAAVTWSLAGLGIKVLWDDPFAVAGFRSLFALPVVFLFLRARSSLGAALPSLKKPLLWGAAASYALTVVVFVIATKKTTAANAILLQYTAPIWVALFSWPILREPLRKADWLAIVGCGFGIAWFFREKLAPSGMSGNLLALVSGVGFGLLPLLLRLAQKDGGSPSDALLSILLGNVVVVVICSPWMFVHPPPHRAALAIVVALGMGQLGMSYVAYAAGVARVRAVEAVLIATIEPILNPIWVALGTGERPSRAAFVGGAAIVASVAVQGILTARQDRSATLEPG